MFTNFYTCWLSLSCLALTSLYCKGQDPNPSSPLIPAHVDSATLGDDSFTSQQHLMQVLRRIYEDKRGNVWFVGDDVYCYNGDSLLSYSQHEVFKSNVVRSITEDEDGALWFGTSDGIVKYNSNTASEHGEEQFVKFNDETALYKNDTWYVLAQKGGPIWVASLGGVSMFDGEGFISFNLPEHERDQLRGVSSRQMVHHLMEDSQGNMWFATNGGAYKFDGQSLKNISRDDGLCHNSVNHILEDTQGNIWFATHHNNVCKWDGKKFIHFAAWPLMEGTEAWSLFEDRAKNIWFPIENAGVYRFDGKDLTRFHLEEGLSMNGVHTIAETMDGTLWVGGFEGLFRFDGKDFTPVTKDNF